MTSTITLTIDKDDKVRKESKSPFGTYEKARECYREGQLVIRKCAGPDVEEMVARGNELRNLEENLEISLNKLESSVSGCDVNNVNNFNSLANNITKNFTIINERRRTGLLIHVNQSKMDGFEEKFKRLKNEFISKCDCKTKPRIN